MTATSTLTVEQIEAKLRDYVSHSYADYAGRAAFYAEDATCFDPIGYPPVFGRDAVRERFRATVEAGIRSKVTITRSIIAGDKAALDMNAEIFRDDVLSRTVSGIITFEFGPDLLIRRMEAFIGN